MKWVKLGRIVSQTGTTNVYDLQGTGITVESRKRHIPHANRPGTWDQTTFWVLEDGVEIIERYTLKEAKEYAEKMAGN